MDTRVGVWLLPSWYASHASAIRCGARQHAFLEVVLGCACYAYIAETCSNEEEPETRSGCEA
jgi:hypothetical protein